MGRLRAAFRFSPWILPALLPLLAMPVASALAGPAPDPEPRAIFASPGVLDEKTAGVRLLVDYGSVRLYRISDEAWKALPPSVAARTQPMPDPHVIHIGVEPIDTRLPNALVPSHLAAKEPDGPALSLVQFVGPIQQKWLDALEAHGVTPVHYVYSNAYLVWTDPEGRAALARLAGEGTFVQWSGPFHPAYKLGPSLRLALAAPSTDARPVPLIVQTYDHPGKDATRAFLAAASLGALPAGEKVLRYENVRFRAPLSSVAEIAARPDVVWVGEELPREMFDEMQDVILAARFDAPGTGPAGPGYLAFLGDHGLTLSPGDYPIVAVTDDGVGTGSAAAGAGDPTFTKLADGTTSRIEFVDNCTTDSSGEGQGGHGHINTSIVGGYDVRTGAPYQDDDGYQRGMGVSPFGRMGHTKIFTNGGSYSVSNCGGTDAGVIAKNYGSGGRISSNSWGCSSCASTYDDSSQAYDVGTRDALPLTAGNQEILFVFAAGNDGSSASTVGSPGNGKNMLTVGASENDRPSWTDGCAIGPTGADNVMDVISFSSRGPSPGGRVKPETIAPGTHIQGTASTSPGYTGASVCDQYLPTGQTIFAASSGTSHSTPAVAGVTSLYYRWLQDHHLMAVPSPAMLKAYVLAHTTYLTGVSANDTLPSNSQGYGMPDLATAFDDAVRYVLDQSVVFDNSGETWTFNGSVADPSKPVRVVLTWTDAAGAIGTSPQVNDLNLEVTVNGATTYLGNVFSGRYSTTGGTSDAANNYEAVFLPAGTAGALDIRVNGLNIAGDGVPGTGDATDQDFALVCYNCAQFPDFTIVVNPISRSACAPGAPVYPVTIGSIMGFSEPATLSAVGLPAGATAGFSVNPVTPPGASDLTVGTAGVAPGTYPFTLTGTSATKTHNRALSIAIFDAAPGAPAPLAPADGATLQPLRPSFSWSAPPQGATYAIEIATDAAFTSIVHSASGLTATDYAPAGDLPSNTLLYWRVRSTNTCGTGADSAVISFTTIPLPGDCPIGTVPVVVYFTDFETGDIGWTSGGTGNTWALSTARPYGGAWAHHASDPTTSSDQRLVSPAIVLPVGQLPLNLIYYNYQVMEHRSSGGCYDGGILEISTAGAGGPWTQLEMQLLTDPYDGPVTTSSNPLNGLNAWCGDPQDWTRTVVDLDAYAGQTVNLRWRLGSDGSVSREGWYVDDVKLQSCAPSSTSYLAVQAWRWSDATPPGNGNGVLEPGERATLEVDLRNAGGVMATAVSGLVSVTSGSATMRNPVSPYPDVASGAVRTNTYRYTFDVSDAHPCGDSVTLHHVVSYDGTRTLGHDMTIPTGTPGSAVASFAYSGPAVSIPDASSAGVDVPIGVGATGAITDVDVHFAATHTYDGDLIVSIRSPSATTVTLSNRRGGSGDNFTGAIFDDEAATPISSGTAPFTGRFIPDALLGAFDGQSMLGTWNLNAADVASTDTGTVNAWSLDITYALPSSCSPALPGVAPPPVPETASEVTKLDAEGTSLVVAWDSTTCPASDYNLYYGLGSQIPTAYDGMYGLAGSMLEIGTDGAAGYSWTGVPDPSSDPTGLLWWVIVGTDGVFTEGPWGRNSGDLERTGPGPDGASGQGPYQTKDASHTTCP